MDPFEQAGFTSRPYKEFSPWVKTLLIIVVVLALVALPGFIIWGMVAAPPKSQSLSVATLELPDDRGIKGYVAPAAPAANPFTGQAPMNILLLGTDARGTMDGEAVLSGDSSDMRADSMILVHVSADRQDVQMISLMRDLWVSIEGTGKTAKLNAALQSGGVPRAVATIEQLIGQPIDHVALVDFTGFKGLVETLDGVTVDNPFEFTTERPKSASVEERTFHKGMIELNGERALAYVRERKAFTNADYSRIQLQRQFLAGVWQELNDASLADMAKVAMRLLPYVTVDDGMDFMTISVLAAQLRGASLDGGLLPTAGTGMEGDQSVVYLDTDRLEQFREALKNDDLAGYLEANSQPW